MQTISVQTEEIAWDTLEKLINKELDADDTSLDFSNAEWIKFNFLLKGDKYQQSLTAPVMKGLIDYQAANYRSIALILKNKSIVSVLNDKQKDQFELIFKITEGSTGADADGKGIAEILNSSTTLEAVKKMSRLQVFTLILTYLLMSYGQGIYAEHLKGVTDVERIRADDARDVRQTEAQDKRDARQTDVINGLLEADRRKAELIEKLISKNTKANEIVVNQENAADSLLKNTDGAEYVILQGRRISRPQLDSLNKQTRRRAQPVFFDAKFIVRGNSPIEGGGFNLTIENTDTGDLFTAALIDPLVIAKATPVQKAEWGSRPVRLQVRAKDKGDGPYEAEIVKVYRQTK